MTSSVIVRSSTSGDPSGTDPMIFQTLGGTYTVGAYRPDDNFLLFNLGASMDFGGATGFISGAATASKGDGDYYAVTLGVRIPIQ